MYEIQLEELEEYKRLLLLSLTGFSMGFWFSEIKLFKKLRVGYVRSVVLI